VEFLPGRGKFCNDLIPLKVFQETTFKDVDIAKAVLYNKNLYQTTLQIIHNVSPANNYRSLLSPNLLDEIINVCTNRRWYKNKYTDGINYLSSIFILEGKNIQKPYLNNLYRKAISYVNLKKQEVK